MTHRPLVSAWPDDPWFHLAQDNRFCISLTWQLRSWMSLFRSQIWSRGQLLLHVPCNPSVWQKQWCCQHDAAAQSVAHAVRHPFTHHQKWRVAPRSDLSETWWHNCPLHPLPNCFQGCLLRPFWAWGEGGRAAKCSMGLRFAGVWLEHLSCPQGTCPWVEHNMPSAPTTYLLHYWIEANEYISFPSVRTEWGKNSLYILKSAPLYLLSLVLFVLFDRYNFPPV